MTSREHGFTLVESLVALVIVSVGLLGMAALYLEGLRVERSAVYRITAIDLAADLADRIRANPNASQAYTAEGASGACAANGAGAMHDCTAAQLAADDIYWWQQTVRSLLPSGTGTIAVLPGAHSHTYTITLSWSEPGATTPTGLVMSVQI